LPWRLTLTGGYLFADLPQRTPSDVHIPLVAVSKSFQLSRLTIANRNRFEKLIGFGTSPVRYRNRLLFDLPLGNRDQWHAFIDDEVLVDVSASKWSQNRFQVGGGRHLNARLLLDLYYPLRHTSSPSAETRVFGTTLKVLLNRH
jgi:uncharacterized protein DUF2490